MTSDVFGGVNYAVLRTAEDILKTQSQLLNAILSNINNSLSMLTLYSNYNVTLSTSSGVGFTSPENGAVIIQIALNTSVVPMISINGYTVYLNSGVAVTANSLYEFMVHVSQNDSITILASATATASVLRVFFRYNV